MNDNKVSLHYFASVIIGKSMVEYFEPLSPQYQAHYRSIIQGPINGVWGEGGRGI